MTLVMKPIQYPQIFIALLILLIANSSHAFDTVCALKDKAIPDNTKLASNSIWAYQAKLSQECEIYKKYLRVKNKALAAKIELQTITVYQALRYVDRNSYTKAVVENMPIPFIYQIKKSDYLKPAGQRSDLVWKNWLAGISQLERTKDDISTGKQINLEYFLKIHSGFFAVGDESGEYGNVNVAGEIKSVNTELISWPIKTQEEEMESTRAADEINKAYAQLNLLPTLEMTGEAEEINRLITVRNMTLFPGHPKANPSHIKIMLNFLNVMLTQARKGEHMVWQDRFFTPMELAYFIQQHIVQIHPFSDGNGRTSRFWQDTILALFDLPYGASGDLMNNDILLGHIANYQLAQNKTYEQLAEIEYCFDEIYSRLLPTKISVPRIEDQSKVPYNCRLL